MGWTVRTALNSNREIAERGKIDTHITQVHNHSLSWSGKALQWNVAGFYNFHFIAWL